MFDFKKFFKNMFSSKSLGVKHKFVVTTQSKDELVHDVFVLVQSFYNHKRNTVIDSIVDVLENCDLDSEEQEFKLRTSLSELGIDPEVFGFTDLQAFCAGCEWAGICKDVYANRYDTTLNKLVYVYELICRNNYTWYINVYNEYDLNEEIVYQIMNQNCIPEYLTEYIDWESFVSDFLRENDGVFTKYGYFQLGELDI